MRDPQSLRDKANLVRTMASRSSKNNRPRARQYLLQLADQFDNEARRIERQRAGEKPSIVSPTVPSRESIDPGPLVGRRHDGE